MPSRWSKHLPVLELCALTAEAECEGLMADPDYDDRLDLAGVFRAAHAARPTVALSWRCHAYTPVPWPLRHAAIQLPAVQARHCWFLE